MTENGFIAPIQIQELYLVESSFHIAETPAQDMDQKLGLDIDAKRLDIASGEGSVAINLTVSTSLVDNANDGEVKMASEAVVHISACASLPQGMSEAEAREYLLSNAVSMAYAHAKSCIMVITGLSPMGTVSFPAILPQVIAHDYLSGRRP